MCGGEIDVQEAFLAMRQSLEIRCLMLCIARHAETCKNVVRWYRFTEERDKNDFILYLLFLEAWKIANDYAVL